MSAIQKRFLMLALVVAIVASASIVANYILNRGDDKYLAYGTIEATEAQLGFEMPGKIQKINVKEGDKVTSGTKLAELDTAETRARLAQAKSKVKTAMLRLEDARRDLKRNKALFEGGAIGEEALDKSIFARDVAHSEYEQAVAAEDALQITLENMSVEASFAGIVTTRHREPGEIVPGGTPVLTVMNPDDRWVRIYIPENRIGAVQLNQKASIQTDTWPEKMYSGRVFYIASEAEFTPKNVQTAEERVNLVYAVKVRITNDPDFQLKPGMPADIYLQQVDALHD